MSILQAVLLGAVQGVAEFLPISSSGHLIALPTVLGWKLHSLQFDIALHMGTLLALVIYFRRDWAVMSLAIFGWGPGTVEERRERRRLAWILILACVPGAIAGFLLEEKAETAFRSPLLVACTLAAMGFVMLLADRLCKGRRAVGEARFADGLFIGVAQALALVPGVSRSGITISAGLVRNLSREDAARFSFLLSVPITLGAGALSLLGMLRDGFPAGETAPFLVGTAVSGIVGYATIAFLLDYLRKHDLRVFVYYRWLLAAVILILALVRG